MFHFKKNKKNDEGIQLLKNALLPKESIVTPTPIYSEKINDITVNLFAKQEEKEDYFWEKISHESIPQKEIIQPKTINEFCQFKQSQDKVPNINISFRITDNSSNNSLSLQKQFKVA